MRQQQRGIKTTNIQRIRSQRFGTYIWKLPNGKPLMDEDYNMLSITSEYGDLQKMAELAKAARYYGYPDGTCEWVEGYKCTDEEYEESINAWLQGDE